MKLLSPQILLSKDGILTMVVDRPDSGHLTRRAGEGMQTCPHLLLNTRYFQSF